MSLSLFNPWNMAGRTRWGEGDLMPEFDKQFNNHMGNMWKPVIEVKENDSSLSIKCEIPGVKKEDIHLDISQGLLTLSGEREQEKKEENEKYHSFERTYGRFQRSFTIPDNYNTEDIKANYTDGILNISLPKIEPSKKESKRIMIE
ncbi:hypothetical protein CYY_004925 [Polysphondylium violaceum]|uniref:SHSP domain-containing protein n=1 Tax=Polysphondylium violaceum TaxID=133409 RepID=A0A8J4USL2_9MYCE|nr:hypothetical protein CYY_004925 [Polysphondylium violaceum]